MIIIASCDHQGKSDTVLHLTFTKMKLEPSIFITTLIHWLIEEGKARELEVGMSPICSKFYLFCFLELLLNITYFARKLHLFCLGLCSALLAKFLIIYRNGIIKACTSMAVLL